VAQRTDRPPPDSSARPCDDDGTAVTDHLLRPESSLTRASTLLALFIVIATTIGCDRVTKRVAQETLQGSAGRSYLADTVRLEWTQNAGAFLGLGADWPPVLQTSLFTIGNSLVLAGLVIAAIRLRWSGLALFGLALFVAGGASNLADRLTQGTVTDFINVGLGPVRTGIFNVADVAIMIGAGLVALASVRASSKGDPEMPRDDGHPDISS